MVVCRDASVLAQLGTPDMKVPIAVGLAHPERIACGAAALDFARLGALTFEEADEQRFPGLHLAWDALRGPEGACCVLNAANEEAVAAFLDGRIRFLDILRVNEETVAASRPALGRDAGIDELLALEAEARSVARRCITRLAA
jgi:1-deoxy-D-xylulose-5-phosphate reductoisomerase